MASNDASVMSVGEEGGCTLIIVIVCAVVGVGGYECALELLLYWRETSGIVGILVRVLNDIAASVCRTEPEETGVKGIKTPGGKVGERRRMYHPLRGRCMDHSTRPVALCCDHINKLILRNVLNEPHHDILDNLLICKKPFL